MGPGKRHSEDFPNKKGSEMPLRDIMHEEELTKENCSPELWEQLGGKAVDEAWNEDDKDLPF